jgi:hypothetical protein
LGDFFEITEAAQILWLLFSTLPLCYAITLTKNIWDTFWGDFSTNLSGHPACLNFFQQFIEFKVYTHV